MWPPKFAYQVWECTTSASSSAAIARSTDIVCSAGLASPRASHGEKASAPARGAPKQRTSRSISCASSRARYSTCTPAPP